MKPNYYDDSDTDATEEPDITTACPACNHTGINRRTGHHTGARWKCQRCADTFDTPTRRQRSAVGNEPRGLAKRLSDADPDEVGP